jgi:hypothetical protein
LSERFIAGRSDAHPADYAMNKSIGFQLIVYGLLLAGLSFLTHQLAPDLARLTLVVGLAGGTLCLVWGLRAVAGSGGKALPLLTLVPVTFLLLSQAVIAWTGKGQTAESPRSVAMIITLLLALSIGMLMRIAYAGAVFDGQPGSPTKDGAAKPQPAGKATTQPNAARRA